MREIKFRAWDGEKMIKDSIRGEYDDYYTMDLGGQFYGHTRTGDEYFNYEKDETNKKKFVLMQYTGLKDKNGKEIYEGDIVNSLNPPYEEQQSINKVKFKNGCWKLISYEQGDIPLYLYGEVNLEVIGNEFESPELLQLK